MRTSLIAFRTELDLLKRYIEALEIQTELLAGTERSESPKDDLLIRLRNHLLNLPLKKRFDYNSLIVSLYGYFEQFLESILRSYASFLNSIVLNYQKLPAQIVKKHIDLSFMLINRMDQTRYRGEITPAQVISNLNTCLSIGNNYRINAEAFSYHTANFRVEIVDEAFARLGVGNITRKVKDHPYFVVAYLKIIDPDRKPTEMSSREALAIIDELAERRNDVAHGVDSDILSNGIILNYICFFQAFGETLYKVLRAEALPYLARYRATLIGSAIKIINNHIVCISLSRVKAKVGDILIAETPETIYHEGEIERIEINGNSVEEVDSLEPIDVGLQIPFKAKLNQKFMILPREMASK